MITNSQKINKIISAALAATFVGGTFSTCLKAEARIWPFAGHSKQELVKISDGINSTLDECQSLTKGLNDSNSVKEALSLLMDVKEKLPSASNDYDEMVTLQKNAEKALKNVKVALKLQEVELRKKEEAEKKEQERLENEHRRKLEEQKFQMEKEERERFEKLENKKALLNEQVESLIKCAKQKIESADELDRIIKVSKEITDKVAEAKNLDRASAIENLISELNNDIEATINKENEIKMAQLEKFLSETKTTYLAKVDDLIEKLGDLHEDNNKASQIKGEIEKLKEVIASISDMSSVELMKMTYEKIESNLHAEIEEQIKQDEIQKAKDELEQTIESVRDPQKQHELLSEGKLKLDDVIGGNKKAKDKVVLLLKAFERYRKGGKIVPSKGILFYGAPGTGKTSLAKAIAAEKKMELFLINPSMVMGENGERKVLETIELAKKAAQISGEPVILLIDEIDAIAQKRSNSSSDKVLVMLMNEVDKLNPSDNVVIIATTNRREALDSAIIRSGRIDQSVEVGLPNSEDKVKILNIYLNLLAVDKSVNLKSLADRMKGFNGADVRKVVDIAIGNAMERQGVTRMCDLIITNDDLKSGMSTIADEKLS